MVNIAYLFRGMDAGRYAVRTLQLLCQRISDAHTAEHAMMECLGEMLWEAQRDGCEPDEQIYLERLRKLG